LASGAIGLRFEAVNHVGQWNRVMSKIHGASLVRATIGADRMATVLLSVMRDHTSWFDHSLEDLAQMGHPYSRSGGGSSRPHGPYDVHVQFDVSRGWVQSSRLLSEALFKEMKISGDAREILMKVGIDTTKAPHAIFIIDGTRYMIQRDFLRGSYNEVKGQLAREFNDGFSRRNLI